MKTFLNNKYFQLLPEILMLLFILFYWVSSTLLNPVAIIFTTAIVFLLFTKNQIIGIILGAIILVANLYLILAYLSDIINQKVDFKFIVFGILFIGVGILISVWLIAKYARLTKNSTFTIQETKS